MAVQTQPHVHDHPTSLENGWKSLAFFSSLSPYSDVILAALSHTTCCQMLDFPSGKDKSFCLLFPSPCQVIPPSAPICSLSAKSALRRLISSTHLYSHMPFQLRATSSAVTSWNWGFAPGASELHIPFDFVQWGVQDTMICLPFASQQPIWPTAAWWEMSVLHRAPQLQAGPWASAALNNDTSPFLHLSQTSCWRVPLSVCYQTLTHFSGGCNHSSLHLRHALKAS